MALLTLFGYTPPARFGDDETAWTQARIEQSTTETGSYTAVETIDLDPVDQDHEDPATRNLTTHDATVGDWYRIVWIDETAFESEPTRPVQLVDLSEANIYGTRTELMRRLKITTADSEQQAALDRVLLVASGEIMHTIGDAPLDAYGRALVDEVALERAAEHWHQLTSPFGFVGLGIDATPFIASRDSWERHAMKLAPIIDQWGIA